MKSIKPFPAELRTMSVIPRWSVLWTLTRDVVSNHSYFVTMYAREIAKLIKWRPQDPEALGDLMYLAMTHDTDETITGDLVSPVKKAIVDSERAADFIESKMQDRLPGILLEIDRIEEKDPDRADEIWKIVKAADRLDALLFLTVERRLGNGVISPQIPSMWAMLEGAWLALPAPKDDLHRLWNTTVIPAVKDHETTGGFGL